MLKATPHGDVTRIELARTFLGKPLYTVAAHLVGDLLVDTGPPATARELVRFCRARAPRLVVNTHYHEDHSGADAALQQAFGVRLLAPPETIPRLAHFYPLPLYRWVVWAQPRNVAVEPLGAVLECDGLRFDVIPTPGHAPDHVCLFEARRGWLFSGDLYISERVRYLRAVEDPWQIVDSLRRVIALDPRLMFCSHAGVIEAPVEALERKASYWERLAAEARGLRRSGLGERQIRTRLLGPEGRMTIISRGDFSKLNLIRALLRDPVR